MKYSKNIKDGYIIGIRKSPNDIITGTEISEKEYLMILDIIKTRKKWLLLLFRIFSNKTIKLQPL